MHAPANWTEGFIAADWGTTNRRAYLIESGLCVRTFADECGILSIADGAFERAVGDVRDRLGERPMLLAGMVGSNRGWVEAPYVSCPAGIDDIARALKWPADDIAIVPGLALDGARLDVMRGEETQILGAVESGMVPSDCLVCHPGTHNKWARVKGGKIQSFRTVMTGELFDLLRDRSILADLLEGKIADGPAFLDGVRSGMSEAGLGAKLFEARARFLLERLDRSDAPSFISGLLIGEDVRSGLESHDSHVVVMGRRDLTELYSAALGNCGISCDQVEGEAAFVAGARAIVERIQ